MQTEYEISSYNLALTLDSGQCFRYTPTEDGTLVFSEDKVCRISHPLNICLECDEADVTYWENYFSLTPACQNEYAEFRDKVSSEPALSKIVSRNSGLRLLRQAPWDTMICFILSQNNNIPRIKQCVQAVCETLGEHKHSSLLNLDYRAMPLADMLYAPLLHGLSLGYRESYLYSASYSVRNRIVRIENMLNYPKDGKRVMQELMTINGIGVKVASCIALFGFQCGEAFPIDIWIERALDLDELKEINLASFGKHRGLLQQYLYMYIRQTWKGKGH